MRLIKGKQLSFLKQQNKRKKKRKKEKKKKIINKSIQAICT